MNPENFEIKYWTGNNEDLAVTQTPKRSVKRKLFIVLSFISVLAIIPVLVYGLSNYQKQTKKVSVIQAPSIKNEEKSRETQNFQTAPIPQTFQVKVLNNDSYWKISKRTCGSGKYYLAIRDQNNTKPLFKGDFVTVTCSL